MTWEEEFCRRFVEEGAAERFLAVVERCCSREWEGHPGWLAPAIAGRTRCGSGHIDTRSAESLDAGVVRRSRVVVVGGPRHRGREDQL